MTLFARPRSSLKARVSLSILALVLLLGALAVGGTLVTRAMTRTMGDVGTETTVELSTAATLNNLVLQMEAALQHYVISGDGTDAEKVRETSREVASGFDAASAGPYSLPQEKEALAVAQRESLDATLLADSILRLPGSVDAGLLDEFEGHVQAGAEALDTLQQVTTQEAQNEMGEVRDQGRLANLLAGGFIIGGLLVAAIGVWIVPRSVVRPVARLTAALGNVADGSLDEEVQPSGIGELDLLTRSFNSMVVRLRERTGELVDQISETEQAEEQVRHLALHDPLTGLPNRSLFMDRFEVALAQARRTGQTVAAMFIDLDRFKLVNDTAGHATGDLVLKAAAAKLEAVLREGDTIARPGGDEFTVLLPNNRRFEDVVDIAERVIQALRSPVTISGREFPVTASVGISVYPHDGTDPATLLRNADTALYFAKEQGRNNYQLYANAKAARVGDRMALVNDLRRGLERQEFLLYYQPLITASTGEVSAVEALIRWQHPERGLMAPDQFIPIAEESGMIIALGDWVLHEACSQAKAWQDAGIEPLRVAVNVSPHQLHAADMVETVRRHLGETGLGPESLRLEITESAFIRNPSRAAKVLRDLRAMGVEIAIDDFGTGYSSLSRLKDLPVDELKIDRSFIEGIGTDSNDGVLASVVVALAHGLKISVTAEGVETPEQLEFLTSRGCDTIQGFLFSRPLPAKAALRLLLRRQPPKAA